MEWNLLGQQESPNPVTTKTFTTEVFRGGLFIRPESMQPQQPLAL
jgi:hypothetical protein